MKEGKCCRINHTDGFDIEICIYNIRDNDFVDIYIGKGNEGAGVMLNGAEAKELLAFLNKHIGE